MPYHPAKQMRRNEIIEIMNSLTDDSFVFEWGAGQSTIFFSQWCKQYHSAEDVLGWFIKVERALVTDNVDLLYMPDINDYVNAIHGFRDTRYTHILIDGSERVRCAKETRTIADKNTIVYLHDFDRIKEDYKPILDWYDVVKVVDNLGVLQVK
jgi:hypothetical protein